jgi:hypothetical protein
MTCPKHSYQRLAYTMLYTAAVITCTACCNDENNSAFCQSNALTILYNFHNKQHYLVEFCYGDSVFSVR